MNRKIFSKIADEFGRAIKSAKRVDANVMGGHVLSLVGGWRRHGAVILAGLVLAGPVVASADDVQHLTGHVPAVVGKMNLQPVGNLPDDRRLNLAVELPLRDTVGLSNLLGQLYDPTSPNYKKFLKPDEFARRFGPSVDDYEKLKAFFTNNHVKVSGTHPNRLILDVNMSVADIRTVFHVNLRTYHHPTEARDFYAPDAEPSIGTDVPVMHISGLDNYVLPRPGISKMKPIGGQTTTGKPALGSGPGGTYFANDFRSAYASDVSYQGNGQTVALFELDGYFLSDIQTYEAQGGLPNIPLVNVPVDGFVGPPTPVGDPEVSLDIEMVIDMAPGLNQILVYEEENGGFPINDILNKIATDDFAKQISSSWLIGDDPSWDPIYLQYAAQGQTFFQCAGDNGSYSPTFSDPNQQFADDPNVTIVGGTTLSTTGPGGPWSSETVWNWNTEFGDDGGEGTNDAGGGGISTNYEIPSWQRGINMTANHGSTTFRNVPDVALTADNIYVVYEEGLTGSFGGTSAATPLWAGFCALVNEKAELSGSPPMGFINPAIYSIAKSAAYSQTFHDITTGNNTNIDNATNYFSVPGYDLTSGWGTPAGMALVNALVPANANVPVLSVVSNVISGGNGNGMIDPDECNELAVTITNAGAAGATDLQGTLVSLTPGVVIGQSTAAFPNLPSGAIAQSQTPFTVSTEPSFVCGTTVILELILKCDQTVQTNLLQFATGTVGPPIRFDSSAAVPIPDIVTGVFSPILVSGINAIGKVTVSVYMTDPEDEFMELQLISPNGTTVLLASADGGTGPNFGSACSPDIARTTFDDAASQSINAGLSPLQGPYTPVSPLSALNLLSGTNVNGVWQLNAINQLTGAAALNCWSLFISPEQCADGGGQCPGSDLSVVMTANPITVPVGGALTYTLSVSNAGPSPASNAVVTQTLPLSVVYQSAAPSQGTVAQSANILTFSLGTIGVQSNATVTVSTVPTVPGLFTSTATVGSPAADPNPNNNAASAVVLVTKPYADLSVSMSADSPSVPVTGQATFFVNVTNNGPATAVGVTVTNFLPASVNVVSANTTQGSVSPGATLISVGSLAPGTGATATVVLSPTILGTTTLTSQAGLDSSETDPIPGNNTASASVTVVPAADLGVLVAVSPSPAVSGGNYSYIVTVTNGGPATASTVTMNQNLPFGVTFVSTSQASAVNNSGVITWSLTNLPSGASAVLTNIVTAPTLLAGVGSDVLSSTFRVFGQPLDPNTNNNVEVVNTVVLRPMAVPVIVGATLTAESFQPPDGAVDRGETVTVQFELANEGNIPTTNLVATLQTNGGVTPVAGLGQADYGALAPGGGTGTGQVTFTATTNNQPTVVATLQLQDGPTNLGLISYTFVLPVVSTFWNTGVISIPSEADVLTNAASGMASPYPSTNLVFGVTNYVSAVTVTVSNLEHTYPHDINMLLVGPNGQSSILMAGAASGTAAAQPVTVTFDQSAASPVPALSALLSQSYSPAQYNSPIFTNVPGLAPPYNANLGVFAGEPANGLWNLYIYDGATGDYGAISNGWALTVTSIIPVNQITDIGVALAASAGQITVGGNLDFTVTVTNAGTNAATVLLTNTLSAGLTFVSNTAAGIVPFQQIGQAQYYNLGTINGQSGLTFGFVATTTAVGTQASTAAVGSSIIDPNLNNNQATASVSVALPVADVAAAISAGVVSNAITGSNVVYTLTVTNNGPGLAVNVGGALAQSASGGAFVVFSNYFGNVLPGTIATALFTNATTTVGLLTNTWTVSTGSTDPVSSNNVALLVFPVTPPEPVVIGNGAFLLSQSFLPPNGAIASNETVTVSLTLENVGAAPATNLTATLQSESGVVPVTTSQNYGTIATGSSVAESFTFTGRGAPGSTIAAVLSLSANGYSLGAVSFPFTISATLGYTNNAVITIPDSGPATPYPAAIAVTSTNGAVVGKVTVTLLGFTHSFPHDVNVLLVGPTGLESVLLAHTGGPYAVSGLDLTFDSSATTYLPMTNLVSGTNLPTLIPPADTYPFLPGQPTTADLTVFNGSNPNGLWSLYVYDDTPGNSGSIQSGWALNVTMINPVNPPNSLALGMTQAPDPVLVGNYLTYQITVTNIGTNGITNVVLSDALPANVSLNAAAASQGTVNTNTAGLVNFSLGTITNAGGTASASITVVPQSAGLAINTASVTNTATGSGATASATATVNLLGPFVVQATSVAGNLRLVLQGQAGQSYVIQTSIDLVHWTALSTNLATGSGSFTFTNSLSGGPEQFYRALHSAQ